MFCHDGDEGVQNPLATNRDQPHIGHGMNADNCYDCLTRLNFFSETGLPSKTSEPAADGLSMTVAAEGLGLAVRESRGRGCLECTGCGKGRHAEAFARPLLIGNRNSCHRSCQA